VIDLFEREPALSQINAEVQHKTYDDFDARAKSGGAQS